MNDDGRNTGEAGERPAVFLSYSRVDLDQVRPIIALLESHGFGVWWDGMLEAGVRYIERTEDALDRASAVVVAWSAQSVASHWVRDEATSGRDSHRLVPITLDGSVPPLGFRQFQVVDFSRWTGDADAQSARALVRAVGALHAGTTRHAQPALPPRAAAATLPRHGGPRASRRQSLTYISAGIGAIVAGGGALTWWLRRDGDGAGGRAIAVLPFANDSTDPAQDYIAAGLAAELRARLARNPALQIVARSSSEVVARRGLDAVAAARTLGVAYIVEGSARVTKGVARVTSNLIDGATGLGRWSRSFASPVDDLVSLQSQLAQEIARALSLEVSQADDALKLGTATVPAAYDEYLRGWDLFTRSGGTADNMEVLRRFDNAVRLDPGFAGARAGQAAAHLSMGHGAQSAAEARRNYAAAVAAAKKAVELGPDLDEAWSVMAQILFEAQLKIAQARQPFARSLELGAGSAASQARFAEYAALTGDDTAALAAARIATTLDPLNPAALKTAALVHYAARRYQKTIDEQRKALALDPKVSGCHWWIGCALLGLGQVKEALAPFEAEPSMLLSRPGLAIAHHRLGNRAAADDAFAKLAQAYGDASAYQQAQVRAQWGDVEIAMQLLHRAVQLGDAGLTYLRMDPLLDPVRQRADFLRLQGQLGFA